MTMSMGMDMGMDTVEVVVAEGEGVIYPWMGWCTQRDLCQ